MESRFEVLEEQTHYPEPKAAAAVQQEETEAEDAQPQQQEELTLETQLEKLMLADDDQAVKNASQAKELGNACVAFFLQSAAKMNAD